MDSDDRKWVISGGGCVVAGLVISLITKSWTWFAVGATTGAAVVGGRLYYKSTEVEEEAEEEVVVPPAVVATSARGATTYPRDMLGAPLIDPKDTSPANKPRMLSRSEVSGYPMRHRIPECDMFALPMDPRGYSGLADEIKRVW